MSPAQLSQYWRTTRHLQFSQIAWRARRLADRLIEQRLPRLKMPTAAMAPVTDREVGSLPPAVRAIEFDPLRLIAELQAGQLTLLNERKAIGIAQIDWRPGASATDRLWNITLHYHAWLYALVQHAMASDHPTSSDARELAHRYLRDWLARCDQQSVPAHSLVWNSYAIATRLEWWVRIIALLEQSTDWADRSLASALRSSAAQQANYLHDHLEWDLRANHLLRDCVGLAMAARVFTGDRAGAWQRTASRLAVQQAREQVLADGGHFERSPMYHLETLEDFALLYHSLAEDHQAREVLRGTIARMTEFARWLQHPDGRTAQLNDCTRRPAAPTLAAVSELLAIDLPERPTGFRMFAETGIACWHSAAWSIFFDGGPVGPDYQPGHTHADTLTLEASLGGERLLIDPGVGNYDAGRQREYDRATTSHYTVTIDGQNSSEVWHIFRVGRRAYPLEVNAEGRPDGFWASAAHTGYDHLPGRPRHRRQVELAGDAILTVTDDVTGDQAHTAQGQWLLEPGWQIEPAAEGWLLTSTSQTVNLTIDCERPLHFTVEKAECHFEFGHTQTTHRLRWNYQGPLPLTVRTQFQARKGR